MGGPTHWKGDKKRAKRWQQGTREQKASMEQNVGRIQPEQRRMKRPAPEQTPAPLAKKKPSAPLSDAEKRLRALNKLLRSIEDLQRRDEAGEELDDAQLAKLGRLDEVLAEMEELMGGSAS